MAIIYPAFIWLISLLFALVLLVFPSASKGQTYNNRENFNQTYPLTQNGRVSISNINGEIIIDTWERNEVKVDAVKIFEDCDRKIQIDIKVDARPDSVKIETEFGKQDWGNGNRNWNRCKRSQVDYKLTVPVNARLDEVESVNGEVKITGAKGFVKASTVNGELTAQNLANSAELSTVNGTLEATFDRLENNGSLKLEAVNGRLRLSIPSDADATVKADTVNGNISNDFGLPVKKGEYVGRDLYGRLGSGNVGIKLSTVNGTIEIKRNNDGRTPKQVSNLLEAKANVSKFPNTAELGKIEVDSEMQQELLEAKREAEQEQRDAQRELANAQREWNQAQRSSSPEERREAEKAFKEAQRDFEQAQRDFERAQREYEKNRNKISKTPSFPSIPSAPSVPAVPSVPSVPSVEWNWNEDSSSNTLLSERETKTLALNSAQTLNIEAKDARVTVTGWDKPEVSYTLLKQAGNESELRQIQAQTSTVGNDVFLKIIEPDENKDGMVRNDCDSSEVELEVFVPRNSKLKINGSDGDTRIENVSGSIEIVGSDGNIDVRDSSGNLKINSSDGRVRVIGFNGAVDAHSSDGNLNLEGDFSTIAAKTSDGTIVLTLKDTVNATIETNAEEISGGIAQKNDETKTWQIGNGKGAKFNLRTEDGEIIVRRQSAITVQTP